MNAAKQLTLFAFDDVPVSNEPKWLEDYDGTHKRIYRMDAEALVDHGLVDSTQGQLYNTKRLTLTAQGATVLRLSEVIAGIISTGIIPESDQNEGSDISEQD
jgi:hypothetical protein